MASILSLTVELLAVLQVLYIEPHLEVADSQRVHLVFLAPSEEKTYGRLIGRHGICGRTVLCYIHWKKLGEVDYESIGGDVLFIQVCGRPVSFWFDLLDYCKFKFVSQFNHLFALIVP